MPLSFASAIKVKIYCQLNSMKLVKTIYYNFNAKAQVSYDSFQFCVSGSRSGLEWCQNFSLLQSGYYFHIVLSSISIGNSSILLTKLVAEVWKYSNIATTKLDVYKSPFYKLI